MFKSFFPRPGLFFLSFAIWSLTCILVWFFVIGDKGEYYSIGPMFGFDYPAAVASDAEEAAKVAANLAKERAESFWFYQFFIGTIIVFCGLAFCHAMPSVG